MTHWPVFATLDAALCHWANRRPSAVALEDGDTQIDFGTLYAAVRARAVELRLAPAIVWVAEHACALAQLIDFLGIVASGRAAALGDPDWPAQVRSRVTAAIDARPAMLPPPAPDTDFYVGFTSGSTGLPKGFRRTHRSWAESFDACLQTFGDGAAMRILAPGRSSHSLFLFGMLLGVWTGAGAVVQSRFSASRALATLGQGHAPALVAVPSQLAMMLERAQRRRLAPCPAVRLVMISGARWMRDRTDALRALFPNARLIEFYGASETSFIAWRDADAATFDDVVGRPFDNVEVSIRDIAQPSRPAASGAAGLIFVRSPMLFTGYLGELRGPADTSDETAALRDGAWLCVRDVGRLDEAGCLRLVGRQKRMIVTQGKNLFPEEVETVLGQHPAVAAASVHGVPDALRGRQVIAFVQPADHVVLDASTIRALSAWCRDRLEAYKAPRRFVVRTALPLTASGKIDHAALAAEASRTDAGRTTALAGGALVNDDDPASRSCAGSGRR